MTLAHTSPEMGQPANLSHIARDLTGRQARWALVTLITVSTLGFSALAYLKYANCNAWAQDTAEVAYAFHQTLQGNFFKLFAATGQTRLGTHADFLLFLWLPVFWLAPAVYTLFLCQSFTLAVSAWPAYLLARLFTGSRRTSLTAAAGFLVFPAVATGHLAELHTDPLGLPFLLFALYFFEREKFGRFALFVIISIMAKEVVAFCTAFFSVYALVRRRNWRWVLFPVLYSAAYLVVALTVLMPLLGNWWANRSYAGGFYFDNLGHTRAEIIETILTKPHRVLSIILQWDRLKYLLWLLGPVLLVLPFRHSAWVVALPLLGISLLADKDMLRSPTHWYSILPGGILWVSFVGTIPRWRRLLVRRFGNRDYGRGLCVVALVLNLAFCWTWLRPREYRRSPSHAARQEAIRRVPITGTVVAPDNMLPHFADRPAIHSLSAMRVYDQSPNRFFEFEYAVFDLSFSFDRAGEIANAAHAGMFSLISDHPNFHLLFSRDNVYVFQRVGQPPPTLKWPDQ